MANNNDKKALKSSIEREQNESICSAECEEIKGSKSLNVPDKRNVPAIRFVEYTEDYARTTLGKIGNTYNGLTGKSAEDFGQGSPYITYKSIFDNSRVDISRVEYVQISDIEQRNKKQNKVARGDIFFTTSSETPEEVGMTSVLLDNIEDCYLNSFCFGYRVYSQEQYLPEYLRFYLRSSIIRKKLFVLAQGSTRFNLSKNEVMRISINMPKALEQRKIARFLTLLEERITTQNKIIEKYESLIQAMCDTLTGRETQQVTLSFSDFGQSYSGLSGKSAEDFGDGYPFITYMNVYQNQIIDLTDVGLVKINETEQQSVVRYGDILLTLSSETPEEVGMGAVYLGDTYPLYLNSFCFGIHITDEAKIYPPFLAYYVSSQSFRKAVYPLAQGSTRFNLQKSDFMKKKFSFPKKEKQRKIYSILNTYSDKLLVEKQIMRLLRNQKCYLLRQLFI